MQRFSRLFLFLLGAAVLAPAVFAQRDIGVVDATYDSKTIAVRVSATTPELNALAQQAFGSHGRYKVVASGQTYDIKFSPVGATQVHVEITRTRGQRLNVEIEGKGKGAPDAGRSFSSSEAVAATTVSGTSLRNALLRAADFAVEKTNGLGLRGFFASKIAFIGQRTGKKEIYTGDLFCGEVKQITRDNSIAMTPRWSPDGQRILYTSFYKNGFPDIYQIDLSSYQRTIFLSVQGTNNGARFSPNGQRVAMTLSGTGTSEIWATNPQGGDRIRLTRSELAKSSPCFSPDGSRIVFAMEPGPQLYVISAGGGSPSRVTTGVSGYCAEPDWSRADPNKIAFTMRVGRNYQIAVVNLSTHQSEQVSKAPFDGVGPSWLPDGRHLVYTARTSTTERLCILDTETGKSTPLSPTSLGPTLQASVWAQ